jgi:hypothetical protein
MQLAQLSVGAAATVRPDLYRTDFSDFPDFWFVFGHIPTGHVPRVTKKKSEKSEKWTKTV